MTKDSLSSRSPSPDFDSKKRLPTFEESHPKAFPKPFDIVKIRGRALSFDSAVYEEKKESHNRIVQLKAEVFGQLPEAVNLANQAEFFSKSQYFSILKAAIRPAQKGEMSPEQISAVKKIGQNTRIENDHFLAILKGACAEYSVKDWEDLPLKNLMNHVEHKASEAKYPRAIKFEAKNDLALQSINSFLFPNFAQDNDKFAYSLIGDKEEYVNKFRNIFDLFRIYNKLCAKEYEAFQGLNDKSQEDNFDEFFVKKNRDFQYVKFTKETAQYLMENPINPSSSVSAHNVEMVAKARSCCTIL